MKVLDLLAVCLFGLDPSWKSFSGSDGNSSWTHIYIIVYIYICTIYSYSVSVLDVNQKQLMLNAQVIDHFISGVTETHASCKSHNKYIQACLSRFMSKNPTGKTGFLADLMANASCHSLERSSHTCDLFRSHTAVSVLSRVLRLVSILRQNDLQPS